MQIIDTDFKRRMIEEKFEQESCNSSILCGNGCEFTTLGDTPLTLRQSILLGRHIRKSNQCPFCKTNNGTVDFQYCVENQDKMQPFSFVMDGERYDTMYKPQGYKFLPPLDDDVED